MADGQDTQTRPEVAKLRDLTQRLAHVVDEECAVLEQRRFDRLKPVVEQKLQLSRAYEEAASRVAAQGAAGLSLAEQEMLRPGTRALRQALERNSVLIAASRTVAERLIRSFGEAVTREARPVLGYGPGAALRMATAAPSAIAINANA